MDKQKYIAIGDIHGCFQTMKALINKLDGFYDRTFVFVGDYIDRGPGSKQVVDFLLDFRKQVDCIFLRGNHEQMMLDAIDKGEMHLWLMNGGDTTVSSYKVDSRRFNLPDEHDQFYRSTEFYYDTPNFFFVHAGLSPSKTISESILDEKQVQQFLWERSHLNTAKKPWEKPVVFGHTPRPSPTNESQMIGIDTGCVYNRRGYGKLTAVKLPEKEFIQQDCID
ncbi:metallophosphoesterase family protein [Fodinibius salsisoli]|uniref:Serine/threonine protein phosphatase n=1 Tax=Fodinibius salsisoli TaxID=2820877 RepID=A0ABT3PQM9_9BACT|nr:serine/threonine protein phosphatase [Fodinibius salsisoli]